MPLSTTESTTVNCDRHPNTVHMSSDGWQPTVDAVTDHWRGLERDWRSVLVGATIVALVSLFELRIPW